MGGPTVRGMKTRFLPTVLASSLLLTLASACGGGDSGGSCETSGGPVTGAADTHCTAPQPITEEACHPGTARGAAPDAAPAPGDAAAPDAPPEEEEEYGPTLFNGEGDDDECKYHYVWSSTGICQGADVYFDVTVTNKETGAPATGGDVRAEVFLDETHPAPNSDQVVVETADGVYHVGPIRFDAAGRWTTRFHVRESCEDGEESPHGHAAFFVDVP